MLEELKVADPELVNKFYKDLGFDIEKPPTAGQIVDKIIDTERAKKPFLKTTGGKILTICLVTVVIAGVLIPIFAGLRNNGDEQEEEFDGLEVDGDEIEEEVENNFLQDPYIAIPGTLPTGIDSITISPDGIVRIVYNAYDSLERPVQQRITFEAPEGWLEMGDSLTADFILNNIPKGAEMERFESVPEIQTEESEDSANDTMDAESDIDADLDTEIDSDTDLDDTDSSDISDTDTDSSDILTTLPTIDTDAPMVSWNVTQGRNGRVKVVGTMIVDGDEITFTAIGDDVEQCKANILEDFWEGGYDVDYDLIP